jgi:hypothetical protein
MLFKRAAAPTAVLRPPVVLVRRANVPAAVFCSPTVLLKRAPAPMAVLCCLRYWQGAPSADTCAELAIREA